MSRPATRQVQRAGFALKLHTALGDRTTESFAREIDKPLRTVQRWRNGETEPSGADLVLIARALGRDASWFYDPMKDAA